MLSSMKCSPNSLITMQSTVTQTKSPTLELSTEQRDRLIELVADRYLDRMDLRDLENFFLEQQADCLTDYTDQELLAEIEYLTSDSEYEKILNELG